MALRRDICVGDIYFPWKATKRLLKGNLSPENGHSNTEFVFNLIKTPDFPD